MTHLEPLGSERYLAAVLRSQKVMLADLNQLRYQLKKNLHTLSPFVLATASQKIIATIISSNIFNCSQNIACFVPTKIEVNVWPIIEKILQQGKNCYLPALDPNLKRHLFFVKFEKNDELLVSKYKIPEPKIVPNKIISPQNLDLVIVPLLGFNMRAFRLGHGGGYYDYTFAFKQQNQNTKPFLLAVGFEKQLCEFVEKPWDISMDQIITEEKIYIPFTN